MPCVRPERSGGTARASQPETAGIGAVAVWSNELEPRRLLLSSPSRGLWINVVDHVERAIARVETVIRSAACEQAAEQAALAEHCAAEALRVFGPSRINGGLRLAQRLLEWLLGNLG
jgi:hypothetical protein